MKVKMLRNPGKDLGCDLTEGETGTVKKDLGEKLIRLGIAEPADGTDPEEARAKLEEAEEAKQQKELKAVPPKAAVADAKPEDFNKLKR